MSILYTKKSPVVGFFYYNDYELLHISDKELSEKVRLYKEMEVEYVIAFSVTHFRWSFYPYEELIVAAIARFVKLFMSKILNL